MPPEDARSIISLLDDGTVIGQADAQGALETIANMTVKVDTGLSLLIPTVGSMRPAGGHATSLSGGLTLPPDLMAMSLTYKERKALRRAGRGQVARQGDVRRLSEIWLWADGGLTDLGWARLEELRAMRVRKNP